MRAECSESLSQPFVVGEEELKKLTTLLRDKVGSVTITAKCADKIERGFDSVKALLSYENSRAKEIKGLRLSAISKDYKDHAAINLRGQWWESIGLSISGDREESVIRLRDNVREILAGARPAYWWLVRDFVQTGFLLVTGLAFVIAGLGHLKLLDPEALPVPKFLTPWTLLLVVGVVGYLLNRLRDLWFPRGAFLIGQGTRRYGTLQAFHTIVLLGLVVGLVTSIVWRFFTGQ
jgi:hypothetical protein